jgi:hypothetical protein
VVDDRSPLPALVADGKQDDIKLHGEPYIDGPIKVDYGTNLK